MHLIKNRLYGLDSPEFRNNIPDDLYIKFSDVDHEIIVIPKKYDNYTNNSGYLVKEKSYVMKEVIDSIDYAKDVINGMALCSCKLRHSGVLVGEERFAQHLAAGDGKLQSRLLAPKCRSR
jgi:hypothetical protein